MVHHQDVQKRARDEILSISASGTIPSFEERDSYPYVNALVMEILRWGSIGPLGIYRIVLLLQST